MNRSKFTLAAYSALLCLLPYLVFSNNDLIEQSNTSSVGNFVWHDKDGDGIQDFGESGIENLRVLLFDSNDNFIGIEYSDNNGFFTFSNLNSGSYRLKFPSVQGLVFTYKDKGSEGSDSDVGDNGYTSFFYVGPNQNVTNKDAGYRGSLQVYIGNSVQSCEGKQIELNTSVFYGKSPYTFQWNNGLGSGPVKLVEPNETTIYSVTVTDFWGSTATSQMIVRVKKGVGEEQCEKIDDFKSDNAIDPVNIEVTPLDPGPKTIVESSNLGLLGNTREITFEHVSGPQPANLTLDYSAGHFTNSNDVGTISQSKLCYNDNKQGLSFDLGAFDYLKFSNIEVDQGGINLIISVSDGTNEVSIDRKLPGLGAATIFDNELPLEFIPGINNLDLSDIYEVCFTFYTSAPSVDLKLESIAACRTTDCKLELTPDQEICLGESVIIEALAPCADNVIYEWDHNLGKGNTHTVSPSQTTTYNVTVTDVDGCVAMGDVTITVNPLPTVTLGPDQELCEASPYIINAIASGGTPGYDYAWNDNSGNIFQKTGIASSNTQFLVTVTDSKGCTDTDQMELTVNENPSISSQSTLVDCEIANGTASASASNGTPPYNFLWSTGVNGFSITGLAAGLYGVTVTDDKGCVDTDDVLVKSKHCGMIGDYVWLDNNGNGLQDDTESGVNGVTVILLNEILDPLDTTLTVQNGYYAFNNLAPDSYHVRFVLPSDFHFASPNQGLDSLDSDPDIITGITPIIVLDSLEQNLTIDAGIYQFAEIGDFVWEDDNGNGIQDNGEAGIANVSVILKDCNQQTISQMSTDVDGFYKFDNLKPADFSLQFLLPSGMEFTLINQGNDDLIDSDADRTNGTTLCESLSSNESNTSFDAGMYTPASIGDYVWHDLNANGIQDNNETGVPDFTVFLLDCNDNPIDTTTTDAQGLYLFPNIIPGSYKISIELPLNIELAPYQAGNNNLTDSDIDPASNKSICFVVTSGEMVTDKDVGLFSRAAIGDRVWEDMNGNGIQDGGEEGLAQITVNLMDCQNNFISSKNTDVNGDYLFDDLIPGSYKIHFEAPANYLFTSTKEGTNDALDSDADPITGYSICEVLISNETNLSYDAGLYQYGGIGDLVWDDLNVNGIQDQGENGVEDIKVILEDCNSIRLDSMQTDQNGHYQFNNLLPGTYVVNFGSNDDIYFTIHSEGDNDELDSDVLPFSQKTECFLVESNSYDQSIDAGLALTGDVGDFVWEDLNGDGVQNTGEPGVANIPVKLYKQDQTISYLYAETSTDVNGYYIFEAVPPGSYFMEFVVPDQYDITFPNTDQDLIDSDITHTNGPNTTDHFDVTPGIFKMDVDAGIYICAEIGDLVWCDYTKNAYWDPDENGINGIEVKLYKEETNGNWTLWDVTTTGWKAGSTCGDGYWDFCTIPGIYYVELNIPPQANLLTVEANQGNNEEYDSDITHANGQETTDIFTVLSQDIKTDIGGGYFYGALIGDTIWIDENANGLQDIDESGIQNVLIELFDSNGKISETYSDYDGSYIFRQLLEGNYYIKVTPPEGMEFTTAFIGNDDKKDSDVDGSNGPGTTDWINLIIEEKNFTIDAGLIESPAPGNPEEGNGFIFPNPTTGVVTLNFIPQTTETIDIIINTSQGEFVKEISGIYLELNQRVELALDLKGLPPGQYSVRVLGKSTKWTRTITVIQ